MASAVSVARAIPAAPESSAVRSFIRTLLTAYQVRGRRILLHGGRVSRRGAEQGFMLLA
jgi:hypothetical protein